MEKIESSYDRFPAIQVADEAGNHAWSGYQEILKELGRFQGRKIVVDCYPGVRDQELLKALVDGLHPDLVLQSIDCFYEADELTARMQANLTDDRVFGVMYYGKVMDFIDPARLQEYRSRAQQVSGTVLIYGFAASLIADGDVLVYADLARWEIQQRYRSHEMGNYKCDNYEEDTLRKYKRGFFIEWRIADKHKRTLFDRIDYLLDTNRRDDPAMITGDVFRAGLRKASEEPFRVVPYFDPGVWGGQWMKEKFGLDPASSNYAWSFDGVPEENSLLLKAGDITVEVPSIDVVLYCPIALLGEKVFARFGAEFPIRFDLLDTIDGGALSLQVHPNRDYIQSLCGMTYTQDESYYILDAQPGAGVYLGLKEGIQPAEMIQALEDGQHGTSFPAEKYVNRFPAKKHDHFLIPAGTVHCSAPGCMVLEISATPYIFTFKLWDWDRLGLDGLPRPIHVEHGKKNIRFDRTTGWVRKNLVNHIEVIRNEDGCLEERTGLHELEFIETRRYTFSKSVTLSTEESVNVLNLVDGREAIVSSPENCFRPYTVHYAETFIIPESVRSYTISSADGSEVKVIRASVRV